MPERPKLANCPGRGGYCDYGTEFYEDISVVGVEPTLPKKWARQELSANTAISLPCRQRWEQHSEIYEVKYAKLSWYTHAAGITGFDLKARTYPILQATAFELAARCYEVLLTAGIDEFCLSKADPRIKHHLNYARKVPRTDTDEQVKALQRDLLD